MRTKAVDAKMAHQVGERASERAAESEESVARQESDPEAATASPPRRSDRIAGLPSPSYASIMKARFPPPPPKPSSSPSGQSPYRLRRLRLASQPCDATRSTTPTRVCSTTGGPFRAHSARLTPLSLCPAQTLHRPWRICCMAIDPIYGPYRVINGGRGSQYWTWWYDECVEYEQPRRQAQQGLPWQGLQGDRSGAVRLRQVGRRLLKEQWGGDGEDPPQRSACALRTPSSPEPPWMTVSSLAPKSPGPIQTAQFNERAGWRFNFQPAATTSQAIRIQYAAVDSLISSLATPTHSRIRTTMPCQQRPTVQSRTRSLIYTYFRFPFQCLVNMLRNRNSFFLS